ncbi:MAG: NADH:ubiquinone reductase (Na(+)-transporting) subunit C [Bacteroidales bacterium]|nr:NADH:ubiquinone reductase (Na(+)-transporting) subunit C [Bacteroidales bacterium]
MNTNSNVYTVIYTTIVVVVVAAVLALVSQSLKSRQEANEKADTVSQMLTAAGFGTKAEFGKMGNAAVLDKYASVLGEAFTINPSGEKVADLPSGKVFSPKELKALNYIIKDTEKALEAELPVFVFNNGCTVVPIYGAGLWGPVWGYLSFDGAGTVTGAYFDHESETAGLGARIKDDPSFQAEFRGEKPVWDAPEESHIFEIVKGGSPKAADGSEVLEDGRIDAITGATMTSNGLSDAINVWLRAYKAYFSAKAAVSACSIQEESCCCSGCEKSCCATCPCEKCCTSDDCKVSCGPECCSEQCGCCGEDCCKPNEVEE